MLFVIHILQDLRVQDIRIFHWKCTGFFGGGNKKDVLKISHAKIILATRPCFLAPKQQTCCAEVWQWHESRVGGGICGGGGLAFADRVSEGERMKIAFFFEAHSLWLKIAKLNSVLTNFNDLIGNSKHSHDNWAADNRDGKWEVWGTALRSRI